MATAIFLTLFVAGAGLVEAQSTVKVSTTNSHPAYQLPVVFQRHFAAMGDRLQKPGQERINMTGTLTDSGGTVPVQVLSELGGKVSISVINAAPKTLSFNGVAASAVSVTPYDSDLLSAFVDDLAETLLQDISQGTGFRPIGERFKAGDGSFCDFYDVLISARQRKPRPKRSVTVSIPLQDY